MSRLAARRPCATGPAPRYAAAAGADPATAPAWSPPVPAVASRRALDRDRRGRAHAGRARRPPPQPARAPPQPCPTPTSSGPRPGPLAVAAQSPAQPPAAARRRPAASPTRWPACWPPARSPLRPSRPTSRRWSPPATRSPNSAGTRHDELAAVIANVTRISTNGALTPSRLPRSCSPLERNRQWWTTGPLLSFEQRVTFPGSLLVWEYYPGQGIEIQWLAQLRQGQRLLPLRSGATMPSSARFSTSSSGSPSSRAGGIAWEYDFKFDGGAPPWVSSISQGTAIQALSRAAVRLGRPAYFDDARQALTIFEAPATARRAPGHARPAPGT